VFRAPVVAREAVDCQPCRRESRRRAFWRSRSGRARAPKLVLHSPRTTAHACLHRHQPRRDSYTRPRSAPRATKLACERTRRPSARSSGAAVVGPAFRNESPHRDFLRARAVTPCCGSACRSAKDGPANAAAGPSTASRPGPRTAKSRRRTSPEPLSARPGASPPSAFGPSSHPPRAAPPPDRPSAGQVPGPKAAQIRACSERPAPNSRGAVQQLDAAPSAAACERAL